VALEILMRSGDIYKPLDIFTDDNIEINYSIANIRDISNTTGSYTKTITLPDTPNNRKLFGYITDVSADVEYNYQVSNTYNPNLKVKCRVLDDTIIVLEGYIQLTRFNIDDTAKNKTIETTIYADNASFYITMGDKLLTDIDFSEYDFTLSAAGITASWSNSPFSYQRGYYFPLIDYGKGWTLNDLQDLSRYRLNVKDFYPAIYVKTIWDKIFASNGFQYTSNFLGPSNGLTSSFPDVRFGSLIIPYYQQTFQNDTLFNQNKIFHVGLTTSSINFNPSGGTSAPSGLTMGWFQSKQNTGSTYRKQIINANVSVYPNSEFRYNWFTGVVVNPFKSDPFRNTSFNDTYSTYRYDTITIPFTGTASPMFNNYVNSGDTYNTALNYYQNRSGEIYKQRFALKTDLVTTYSNQWVKESATPEIFGVAAGTSYNYIIKVEFFREYDPVTGTTSVHWATGTGSQIPADLGADPTGGLYNESRTPTGTIDKKTHWVCDVFGKSNCNDIDGKVIKPLGTTDRYLGKYCTNENGNFLLNPTNNGDIFYRRASGDCRTWYYNDAFNQATSSGQGLWVSGYDTFCYTNPSQATHHPAYGDWYQNLMLQTIYLDGDETNSYYGVGGSIMNRGNTPIQPYEKVRVVVTLGGKYRGQSLGTPTGISPAATNKTYKPPTACYVLASTNFEPGGSGGTLNRDNVTQFWNDVSPDYITGQQVSFNSIIPKNLKQRDFIQDIVRLHNLYIEPIKSNENNLIIEPRDQYYGLATDYLDWKDKLDISQPITVQVLAETQYKRTRFTFKQDTDWYNRQYEGNTNEIYGQFVSVLDNEFITDELKIESMFSPTPMTQLYSYFAEGGGDTLIRSGGIILPVFLSGNSSRSATNGPSGGLQTNYRILYRRYLANQNGETIFIFGNRTNVYPYAGPYDNPYDPTYAVNWGQTLAEFFPTPTDQFSDNLVNSYWASLLTELGDMDSKLITCYMFLMPEDINQFYFHKQVLLTIDGVDGYYKINSIEGYYPGQNMVCKVTLLKSKTNLPIKQFKGSTSITPPGSVIILPGGGGAAIPGPSPSA
jgi:hypothetical protein